MRPLVSLSRRWTTPNPTSVPPMRRSTVRAYSASVSRLPGSSATVSIPGGLSTITTSRSEYTIALFASGPLSSFGPCWSTTTVASARMRAAGSRQRFPSTVTRPSLQSLRARDHETPVCSRTTAATVGAGAFTATLSPALSQGRGSASPAGALHEIERGLEDLEILLVVRRIFAVDLHPLLGARHAARLEGDHVLPRELQLARRRDRKAKADAVAADAGEHPVVHEVAVERADLLRDDARKLDENGVDLGLAGWLCAVGSHRCSLLVPAEISAPCASGACARSARRRAHSSRGGS